MYSTTLLTRIRAGDAAAFTQLIRPYLVSLIHYAHRETGSQSTAEDLVQDVLLSIWNRRAQLPNIDAIKPYLFRAVHHHILNHYRAARREHQRIEYTDLHAIDWNLDALFPGQPDAELDEQELRAAYEHALTKLPDRPRQVFLLIREHELSYRETAEALGISIKTVEMHMGRALATLRIALRDWRR